MWTSGRASCVNVSGSGRGSARGCQHAVIIALNGNASGMRTLPELEAEEEEEAAELVLVLAVAAAVVPTVMEHQDVPADLLVVPSGQSRRHSSRRSNSSSIIPRPSQTGMPMSAMSASVVAVAEAAAALSLLR